MRQILRQQIQLLMFGIACCALPLSASLNKDKKQSLDSILKKNQSRVIRTSDDLLFLRSDLECYQKGISATAEALSSIKHFHDLLRTKSIELIVIPVPGKISAYADKLNLDSQYFIEYHKALSEEFSKLGIKSINLHPEFLNLRKQNVATHLKHDSHWSQEAVIATAKIIEQKVRSLEFYEQLNKESCEIEKRSHEIKIKGDLREMISDNIPEAELVKLHSITIEGIKPGSDESSPIVLMGDSHNIVFHSQDGLDTVPFTNGGLPDYLVNKLKTNIDNVAVLGSGANGSRAILARRRGQMANLSGKECVIWVFSVREFTHSTQDWKNIPVIR